MIKRSVCRLACYLYHTSTSTLSQGRVKTAPISVLCATHSMHYDVVLSHDKKADFMRHNKVKASLLFMKSLKIQYHNVTYWSFLDIHDGFRFENCSLAIEIFQTRKILQLNIYSSGNLVFGQKTTLFY